MECPKCKSNEGVKNGFVKGVQRYKCGKCKCQYTRSTKRGRSEKIKLLAVALYAHGLSINFLAKMFKVSAPGMLGWIREFDKKHCQKVEPSGRPMILELDEMWHYVQKKSNESGSGKCWIVLQGNYLSGKLVIEVQKP